MTSVFIQRGNLDSEIDTQRQEDVKTHGEDVSMTGVMGLQRIPKTAGEHQRLGQGMKEILP